MAVLIIWTAIEIPFVVAFVTLPHPTYPGLSASAPLGVEVVDKMIDALFLADVLVCFSTGYVDRDDLVTMDQWKVFGHYLRGWFFIDFISAFPFDVIAKSASNDQMTGQLLAFVSMLKLLRLLRLQKLLRYFQRWSDDLGLVTASSSIATRMSWLVFCVLIFIHVNACFQFIVPLLSSFPHDSWTRLLLTANVTTDCEVLILHAAEETPHVDLERARWGCYSHAFFQALSQMLCIGFGLVNPKRSDEVWVTILSMFTGASVYAVSLAFAVNVFSNVDHPSRLYKNSEEVLNEFMRVRALPTELRTRLRSYFQTMYPNRRIFNERTVVGEFSYTLRSEIRMAMCAQLFACTPIFESADPALLSAISPWLHSEVCRST